MASAPTPGVGARADAAAAAKQMMTITIQGRSLPFAFGNIPIKERAIVRKETGLAFEAYWAGETSIGMDSIQVLWWLARRASGEWQLTLTNVVDEWPDDLTEDDIEIMVDEPDVEDSPEV